MAESMSITKKRLKLIKDNEKQRKDILGLEDIISALTNENQELELKVKKWESMQSNGYTAVSIKDGSIIQAVQVLPHSIFTFTQEIPEQIGTALYNNIPYYELDQNGKIDKNIQKYNRYMSI